MNYKHIYHAGNFADVVKHSVLAVIIDYLKRKPTPFCYIDTHAGASIYDLTSNEATITGESLFGIQKIIAHTEINPPISMRDYLQLVKIDRYPGSPTVAFHLARPVDQLILNEAHPTIYSQLKNNLGRHSNIHIHQRDAYEFLPAILPPREKRGLVLIDPPYENKNELNELVQALNKALSRWAHGIYLVWLPTTSKQHRLWSGIDSKQQRSLAQRLISKLNPTHHLTIDFTVYADEENSPSLLGCELVLINPPWKIEETLKPLLKYIWNVLKIDASIGGFRITRR